MLFETAVSILTAGYVNSDIDAIYENPELEVDSRRVLEREGVIRK